MPPHLPILLQTIKAGATPRLGPKQAPPPLSTQKGGYSYRVESGLVISFRDRFLQGIKGFESSEVSLKVHKWVQNDRTKCTKHLGNKTFLFC